MDLASKRRVQDPEFHELLVNGNEQIVREFGREARQIVKARAAQPKMIPLGQKPKIVRPQRVKGGTAPRPMRPGAPIEKPAPKGRAPRVQIEKEVPKAPPAKPIESLISEADKAGSVEQLEQVRERVNASTLSDSEKFPILQEIRIKRLELGAAPSLPKPVPPSKGRRPPTVPPEEPPPAVPAKPKPAGEAEAKAERLRKGRLEIARLRLRRDRMERTRKAFTRKHGKVALELEVPKDVWGDTTLVRLAPSAKQKGKWQVTRYAGKVPTGDAGAQTYAEALKTVQAEFRTPLSKAKIFKLKGGAPAGKAPPPAPKVKATYTSLPKELHGKALYDWGKKGLRFAEGETVKIEGQRPRKSLDTRMTRDFARILVGNPKHIRRAKQLTDEVLTVHVRRGKFWNRDHYLVPKAVKEQVIEELGPTQAKKAPPPAPKKEVPPTREPTEAELEGTEFPFGKLAPKGPAPTEFEFKKTTKGEEVTPTGVLTKEGKLNQGAAWRTGEHIAHV
jgi:hypothetical protein